MKLESLTMSDFTAWSYDVIADPNSRNAPGGCQRVKEAFQIVLHA